MRNLRNNRGFTLLELMLVIALVGILALVTAPKYGAIKEHYRLQSSAEEVKIRLNHAKQLAMDTRENVTVKLTTNTVEVINEKGNSVGPVAQFDPRVEFDVGKSKGLKDATSSEGSIQYNNKGFVVNAGGFDLGGEKYVAKIYLKSASGASINLYIKPGTGKVSISSVDG